MTYELLRAREVADLDPYGLRKKPAQDSAKDLLDEQENEIELNIIKKEKQEWKKVLGVDVEIAPLPEYLTSDRRELLRNARFNILYIPHLELENGWRGLTTEAYLNALQRDYPNWKSQESLAEVDLYDPNVPKNLSNTFWNEVKSGNIPFPNLEGKWIGVEGRYGDFIEKTVGNIGFYHHDWNEIKTAIVKDQIKVLQELGVWEYRAHLRLPSAIEWNLLANRFKWGSPGEWDWTDTETQDGSQVVVGIYDDSIQSDIKITSKQRRNFNAQPIIDFSRET